MHQALDYVRERHKAGRAARFVWLGQNGTDVSADAVTCSLPLGAWGLEHTALVASPVVALVYLTWALTLAVPRWVGLGANRIGLARGGV